MATFKQYTASGGASEAFSIKSFSSDEIKVRAAGVLKTAGTHYNITSYTNNGGTVTWISPHAPSSGTVRIYRVTDVSSPQATYSAGSSVKADDLNNNQTQLLRSIEEENDQLIQTWDIEPDAVDGTLIKDDSINSEHYAAGSIDNEHMSADSINSDQYVDGSIDLVHLSNNSVDSSKIVDGSIVNADVNASAAIAGTKVSPAFGSQNISTTGTLAAGSTNITGNIGVSGTVDGRDVGADGSKLDGIAAGATADQTAAEIRTLIESASDSNVFTDADHTKLNAIEASATADQTAAEIRALVESASDSNVFTDADHSKLNNIAAGASDDQTAAEIKTLLQSDKLTDAEIATGTLDGRYFTETELTGGALDGRYFTETEADARYFNISTGDTIKDGDAFPDNDTTIATTAAINDRIIDLVDDVGGFVPIANETSFPNANPDVNNGTGTLVSIKTLASNHTSNGSGVISISNGTVGNSTVTINGAANSTTYSAGYGMIVETTATLNTYTFHRLVPKATEITTVAGKATEIGRLGTADAVADLALLGTADIVADMNLLATSACVADMALLGDSAVIADMATIADTSNLIANLGTVAGIHANVTTVAGISANVTTVASNITDVNNFADLYQIASSNPSADGGGNSLATGDLYFNTSANELKVWNGSAWQGGVTATGSFAVVTGNTFTGDNKYNDGVKALVGTGSDLEIFHTSDVNNIKSVNGKIVVETTAGNADIEVTPHGSGVVKLDGLSWPTADGSANYVLQTNGSGVLTWAAMSAGVGGATGVDFNDNVEARWGTDNDLVIEHTAGNSFIKDTGAGALYIDGSSVRFRNYANSETMAEFIGDGEVNLYHNNIKTFATSANGVTFTGGEGNSCELYISADEGDDNADKWRINALSSGSVLQIGNYNNGSGWDTSIECNGDGNVELYYDNSKKLETTSTGWKSGDNIKGVFGADDDLQIYHNGNWNFIDNIGSKNFVIRVNDSEDAIIALPNGTVQLNYDGNKKFETTNTGVTVTGTLTATLAANSIDSDHYVDGSIDNAHLADDAVGIAELSATGTASSSTYLRGDNTWATVSAGGFSADAQENLYAGTNAGAASDADTTYNIAIGYDAGKDLNEGDYNIFIGKDAGKDATSGSYNIAFGIDALGDAALTGNHNFAVGYSAGEKMTSGYNNILLGYGAGGDITTGDTNIAIGYEAMAHSSDNSDNIAIGDEAFKNGTGDNNIVIGSKAADASGFTGQESVIIGNNAGSALTGAQNDNVIIGKDCYQVGTTGSHNVVIGKDTYRWGSGSSNVAIGSFALQDCTASNIVAVGYNALRENSSGSANTAVGDHALREVTTGNYNTAVGFEALKETTSSSNTALGYQALKANTSGSSNTAVGDKAGDSIQDGGQNVCIGAGSGQANVSGIRNTACGTNAASQNTGSYITAFGYNACQSNVGGGQNTGVGYLALQENSSNAGSTALGFNALMLSTGGQNTGIGAYAGDLITTGSNLTCIGYNVDPSAADATNEVSIGNSSVTKYRFNTKPGFIARGWVNFDGSSFGTNGSGNVDSMTDNGTGDYTVTWDVDMPNDDYCIFGTAREDNAGISTRGEMVVNPMRSTDAVLAGSVRFSSCNSANGTQTDCHEIFLGVIN